MKKYTSLMVIIAAALLLELTTAVLYYAAQNIIQQMMEQLVERDMNAIYLTIHQRLAEEKSEAAPGADSSFDWLDEVLDATKVYHSSQRFLVSGNHHLLAGKDGPLFRAALEQLKADDDGNGYVTLEDGGGEKKHVFFTPVGGKTDWLLMTVVDDSEVFGKLRKIRMALLLPVMIGLFFAACIVWHSTRHLERMRRVNAEKERIKGELCVASQIQQTMLPPRHMSLDDVDISGSLVPAREVGGDLFDYDVRDGKLFFCIGDVSGKGAPSAMVMGVVHSLFRAFSAREDNPARIMQAINEVSCRGNDSSMFVTIFLGVLDLSTGRLKYCDAGHDAPFVIHAETVTAIDVQPHLPLGVFDDVEYGMQEMLLPPDSTLFLYTDGLTEARRARKQWFGLQRVEELLATCGGQRPRQLLDTVTEAVHQFVQDAEQSDDLTLLAIRYHPRHHDQ